MAISWSNSFQTDYLRSLLSNYTAKAAFMRPKGKGWGSRADAPHLEDGKDYSSAHNNKVETLIHDSHSAIIKHSGQDGNILHQDDIEIGKLHSPEPRRSQLDISQSKAPSISQGSSKKGKTDSGAVKKEPKSQEDDKDNSREGVGLGNPEEDLLKDMKEKDLPPVSVPMRDLVPKPNRGETHRKLEEDAPEAKSTCKQKMGKLLKSPYWSLLISFLTLYTLFSDDIKEIAFTPAANPFFDTMVIICVVVFTVEIVICLMTDKMYVWSFYFWLDIVSTLTMLLDLSYISSQTSGGASVDSLNNIFRSAKTARLGSRAGRIGRIFRVAGVFRITKIFKEAEKAKKRRTQKKSERPLDQIKQEKESLIKKIKVDAAQVENLRRLLYLRRMKIPGAAKEANQILKDKGITFGGTTESEDFSKDKGKKQIKNKSSGLKTGSRKLARRGKSSVKPVKKKPVFNMNLLKAMKNFRTQGTQLKKESHLSDPSGEIRPAKATEMTGFDLPNETVIGRIIIDKNTKVFILFVLIMVVGMLFLDVGVYRADPDTCMSDLGLINEIVNSKYDPPIVQDVIKYIISQKVDAGYQLIDMSVLTYASKIPSREYWSSHVTNCSVTMTSGDTIYMAYDRGDMANWENILSITKMVMLIVILYLGSFMFTKDANNFILTPIKNILTLISLICKNPEVSEQIMAFEKDLLAENEMKLLEKKIPKLGSLLMLVYGRAGNNMLNSNIANLPSEEVEMETEAEQIMAFYGFCDVRNFQDLTEVLQEDTLPLINHISKIVHSSVVKFLGTVSRNIGETFQLVWPLPEECLVCEDGADFSANIFMQRYAEASLAAMVEVLIKISFSQDLRPFTKRHSVQSKLSSEFVVQVGFGLHRGWGLEGLVGTYHKVDNCYLSSQLQTCSRLEGATKMYELPIVISEEVYSCLSPRTRSYCRLIDRVMFKGSDEAVNLYGINVQPRRLKPATYEKLLTPWSPGQVRQLYLKDKNYFRLENLVPAVRECVLREEKFDSTFNRALQLYFAGQWTKAGEMLEQCLAMRRSDGPSKSIYEYIRGRHFSPPSDWKGVRILTDK